MTFLSSKEAREHKLKAANSELSTEVSKSTQELLELRAAAIETQHELTKQEEEIKAFKRELANYKRDSANLYIGMMSKMRALKLANGKRKMALNRRKQGHALGFTDVDSEGDLASKQFVNHLVREMLGVVRNSSDNSSNRGVQILQGFINNKRVKELLNKLTASPTQLPGTAGNLQVRAVVVSYFVRIYTYTCAYISY